MIAAPQRVSSLVAGCFFNILAGTALAQQVQDVDTQQQHSVFAEAFVNEKLAVWQRNLSLEDWKISIVMCRRSDLKFKTLGGIRWDRTKRIAAISVLAASEYRLPVGAMLDDMEQTIVHELIHVHLSALPRSEASRRDEERAVNQIAKALLNLERGVRQETKQPGPHPF
jgi:hypothetical protein